MLLMIVGYVSRETAKDKSEGEIRPCIRAYTSMDVTMTHNFLLVGIQIHLYIQVHAIIFLK